jgi:putative Mg2+ transporter-C (MgtC) family protein
MMDILLQELNAGLPEGEQIVRLFTRVTIAMILGALIGYQREQSGKPAGLRTHILVAMGSAMFVIAATESGMSSDGVSRVIQGIITGIGFIGAGAILKLGQDRAVYGLTTSAGIWATAAAGVAVGLGLLGLAAGVAVGLGLLGLALLGVLLIWFVLAGVGALEARANRRTRIETRPPAE